MPNVLTTIVKPNLVHVHLNKAQVVVYAKPDDTAFICQQFLHLINSPVHPFKKNIKRQTIAIVAKILTYVVRRVCQYQIIFYTSLQQGIQSLVAICINDS